MHFLSFCAMPGDQKIIGSVDSARDSRLSAAVARALGDELVKPLRPGLYLVSTPIGNLADITLRALAVLARANMVFCEDTRHSRKLFSHFGISRDLEAYHEHNAAKERPRIIARIRAGQSVVLIADAGTPLVSDPGHKLVRALREEGLPVFAVPGASAVLTALTASGMPTDSFFFEGFLPPKPGARRKRLEALRDVPATLVFYEAPQRLVAMLKDTGNVLGQREGGVAKELTKLHEGLVRAPLPELVDKLGKEFGAKGEFVVLVGPPAKQEISNADIEEKLAVAFARGSLRDAVEEVSQLLGLPRNRVYKLALALQGEEK